MRPFDAYRYDGKRVLVVGGASGMGAAVAELTLDGGAEVIVMDRADVELDGVAAINLDLSDRDSVERAVAQCDGELHAVFCCAGVASGPMLPRINFLGHRLLIETLLSRDLLRRGGAIGFISSFGGIGWENSLDELHSFLDISDFDEAATWADDHGKTDYIWSKKAINLYVTREAAGLLERGIRINAIMPGPTDTPLAQANKEMWLDFGSDYREKVGIDPSTPLEQAYPLVFLCSDAASGVTGTVVMTDAGYVSAGIGGSFAPAQEAVGFLRTI